MDIQAKEGKFGKGEFWRFAITIFAKDIGFVIRMLAIIIYFIILFCAVSGEYHIFDSIIDIIKVVLM